MQADSLSLVAALVERLPKCRMCKEPATLMGASGARCEKHGAEVGVFNYHVSYANELAPVLALVRSEASSVARWGDAELRAVLGRVTPEIVKEETGRLVAAAEEYTASNAPTLLDVADDISRVVLEGAYGLEFAGKADDARAERHEAAKKFERAARALLGLVALMRIEETAQKVETKA